MQPAPRSLALLFGSLAVACGETTSPPIVAKPEAQENPVAPPLAPEMKPVKTEAKTEPKPHVPEAALVAAPSEPAAPPPVVSQAAGPAFFAVDKKGIVRLDGGEFVPLKDGPDELIKNLHIAADGALWVLGFETIYKLPKLDADGFKEVVRGDFRETGTIDDFFVVADDDLWVAGFGGVSHWDGKAWTREEKPAIGAGDDILDGIAVDREGKVWIASSNRVHVKDRGAWSTLDLGKIKDPLFMEGVGRAADGTVYALASAALIKLGPGAADAEAVKIGGGSVPSYSDLALGTDGTFAARNLFDLVISTPKATKVWRKKDYMSEGVRALAVDASGRVWVGGEIGVTILGPGDVKVEWPSGSVPELSGEVVGVAVAGAGPAVLPATGPVQTGGLKGKLLRGGGPVVGVEVELCPSPKLMFTKTPCADSSVKFAGKTDDQGEWKFDAVPLGAYGIALKSEGKWRITMGSDLGIEMRRGEVFDVGSISLDK
ncbi:hypothetical protein [Nannocystis punicea]|uniref:Two component regulator propeller n=1 Tax=Nannocystis punicea TaxID=2995304 RepID=A0ABY7GZH9_9BACT|nr:hypothetical protein [Nannocystis poenicansa]WAS92397.1 hypothetical protein O0S08_39970 [Nannocystis poenicansa]